MSLDSASGTHSFPADAETDCQFLDILQYDQIGGPEFTIREGTVDASSLDEWLSEVLSPHLVGKHGH